MSNEFYSIAPIADWIIPTDIDLTKSVSIEDSPYNYPLVDYQDLILDNEIHYYKRTIQKINDSSRIEDASLYLNEVHEGNQRVIFHAIDIIRNGERINALDEENISAMRRERSLESHITNNNITISLSIDDLREGDTVDYAYTFVETSNEHPLIGSHYHSTFWLTWSCPVLLQTLRLTNRSSQTLNVLESKSEEGTEKHQHSEIAPNSTFEREYKDLMPIPHESTSPSWHWGDYLQVTTKKAWKDISKHLYKHYVEEGVLTNNINLNDIHELELGDNKLENVINIIRFVQNKVRYKGENHGIYTHTPKAPERTLKKRAGDCKDKSNLLVSMLRAAGFDADLVLVSTRIGQKIGKLNPSPYQFNHMIAELRIDEKIYYFDPTIQKQSGDLEHSAQLRYAYGLKLTEEGSDLLTIPYELSYKVFNLEHIFDFSDKENTLTIYRHYKKHRADNMRFQFYSKEKKKYQDDFLNYAKDDTSLNLEMINGLEMAHDDAIKNILQTKEVYKIIDIEKSHADKRLEILTDFYKDFPIPQGNQYPVGTYADGIVEHNILVKLSGEPDLGPTQFQVKNDFFKYADKVWQDKFETHYLTKLEPLVSYVDAKDIDEYRTEVLKIKGRSLNILPFKAKAKVKKGDDVLNSILVFFGLFIAIKLISKMLGS